METNITKCNLHRSEDSGNNIANCEIVGAKFYSQIHTYALCSTVRALPIPRDQITLFISQYIALYRQISIVVATHAVINVLRTFCKLTILIFKPQQVQTAFVVF